MPWGLSAPRDPGPLSKLISFSSHAGFLHRLLSSLSAAELVDAPLHVLPLVELVVGHWSPATQAALLQATKLPEVLCLRHVRFLKHTVPVLQLDLVVVIMGGAYT